MPKFLATIGQETRGLHEAAYLVAGLAFLSQVLALVRDRLLASTFGASGTLDIYYTAFRIPDFLFATVASLLSLYALLPVLSRLERENESLMLSFLRQSLLFFFAGMAVISGIVFVFVPQIIALIAPGLVAAGGTAKLVLLTRILLLQPILLGASNILANLTQLRHRFLLYSISPLLYNIGIIAGVVVLYPHLGVAGLGWGVVLGALLHVLVQAPFFAAERPKETLPFMRALRELKEVVMLSIPRTFALASTQISLVVLTALATLFSAGSVSVFMFAYNLQAVPLAIIGVSYSVAAFPTLARHFAAAEHGEFVRHIETALRHMLFWSIPATVFIIVLRAELVRVILGAGAFDWAATKLTAAALALFVLSLAAQNITLLIARAYYAAGNTRKPLYYGFADIVISIGSALALVALFHQSHFLRLFVESLLRVDDLPGTTVLMLALGYALGSIAECIIGLVFFVRDFSIPLRRLRRLALQSLSASVIGGAVSYALLAFFGGVFNLDTVVGVFLDGFLAGIAGMAVTALALYLFKSEEFAEAAAAIRRRVWAPAPALEPTDVAS